MKESSFSVGPRGGRLHNIRTESLTGPLHRQFQYDDAGRLIEKLDGADTPIYIVQYNGKGRAEQITAGAQAAAFAYDANDYRVRKDDRLYYLEGEHQEAVYSDTGELVDKYFRGVIVDEIVNGYRYHSADSDDWTNYTFHHDHLNSVTALSGHAGDTEQTWTYDAFGRVMETQAPGTGNELLYTGRNYDQATGLYYYRARYYDPEIGRFISEDPLGFEAGVNFYVYVGNNPLNANDPSGHLTNSLLLQMKLFKALTGNDLTFTLGASGNVPFIGSGLSAGLAISPTSNQIGGFLEFDPSPNIIVQEGLEVIAPEHGDDISNLNGGFDIYRTTVDLGVRVGDVRSLGGAAGELYLGGSTWVGTLLGNGEKGFSYNGAEINWGPQLRVGGETTFTGVLGFDASNFEFFSGDFISSNSNGGAEAGGGFVLYPSKPNTNTINAVYRK